jgi:hypothetical protein
VEFIEAVIEDAVYLWVIKAAVRLGGWEDIFSFIKYNQYAYHKIPHIAIPMPTIRFQPILSLNNKQPPVIMITVFR